MRLKIELPSTWAQQNLPDGPPTFCRQGSTAAFQVSWAEYTGGAPLPPTTPESLKQMATGFGTHGKFGELVDSSCGAHKFGSFGAAVFRSAQHPRIQVWFISDGRDHIMATHVCDREPLAIEVAEAQQIASTLALGPEHPA